MANKNLNAAKMAKKDEFYTQMSDIEMELQHYWPHFHDKVVLCNCDDPFESNFFKYFALHFNHLGLKKLICTCYNGSPIQGDELLLPLVFEDEEPKKIAHKVVITEVKDLNGDGAVDLSDVRIRPNARRALSQSPRIPRRNKTRRMGKAKPHLSPLPKGIPLRTDGRRPHHPLARMRKDCGIQLSNALQGV